MTEGATAWISSGKTISRPSMKAHDWAAWRRPRAARGERPGG